MLFSLHYDSEADGVQDTRAQGGAVVGGEAKWRANVDVPGGLELATSRG